MSLAISFQMNTEQSPPPSLTLQPARVIVGPPSGELVAREFQGIPGVACTRDGTVWACWYGGGKDEGPDNYVMLTTRPVGEAAFREPWLHVVSSDPALRVFDPTLWVDPQQRLWLFWTQAHIKPENNTAAVFDGRPNAPDTRLTWDGLGGVWGTCCADPINQPEAWSPPVRFCDGVMMNKPNVDEQGHWLLPTTIWELKPFHDDVPKHRRGPTVAVCSNDTAPAEMRGTADIADAMFDEHIVLPLRDGRWAMWVRTMSRVRQAMVSYSSDRGVTWTRGVYTNVPCPNSRFFIGRLKSGALLLVSHYLTEEVQNHASLWPDRSRLTAWVSDDDGQTWIGGLMIDTRDRVSYPDAHQADDGTIHIIYDYNRYTDRQILHVELTEAHIRQRREDFKGSIVNQVG